MAIGRHGVASDKGPGEAFVVTHPDHVGPKYSADVKTL